ncbi:hypothetical protein ATKI12_7361 [Kitasatospora sp. Ki12]
MQDRGAGAAVAVDEGFRGGGGPAGALCEFHRTDAQGDLFITGGGAEQVCSWPESSSDSLLCKPVHAFGYRSSRWA